MSGKSESLEARDHNDHWYGVQDARKRKQIQDRLAQRARRKRLALSKDQPASSSKKSKSKSTSKSRDYVLRPLLPGNDISSSSENSASSDKTSPGPDSEEEEEPDETSPADEEILSTKHNELSLFRGSDTQSFRNAIVCSKANTSDGSATLILNYAILPSKADPKSSSWTFTPQPLWYWSRNGPKSKYLAPLNHSVCGALFNNGCQLGLVCGHHVPSKSAPPTSTTPYSLRPTMLQSSTVHLQLIDQFPFPRMRDRLIVLGAKGRIDIDLFIDDLVTTDGVIVEAGSVSWDPAAWKLRPGYFKDKWGFLFK